MPFDKLRQIGRLIALAAILISVTEPALALPIFARRYETACTTCHVLPPKLNAFGVAFRNNGYRIPSGDEQLIKEPDVALGAPAWKKAWPKSIWPGAIPSHTPVAIRVLSDAGVRPSQPIKSNFDFPSGVGVYFAGPSGDTISFFGNLFANTQGQILIDRAYAQFRIPSGDAGTNWLNIRVGRIDPRAEPFSSTTRRTTIQQFNVSEYRPVSDSYAFRDRDAGLELWGAATGPGGHGGVEYSVGVVQGTNGKAENNNFKDYYGAISIKRGGYGVAGPRAAAETPAVPSGGYSESSVQAGIFFYQGKNQPRIAGVRENPFLRTGFKFDGSIGKLNAFGAIVRGRDLLAGSASGPVRSTAAFGQADYLLLPWLMPSIRIEQTKVQARSRVVQWIPSVNIGIRANVRVVAEGHLFNRGDARKRTGVNEAVARLEFLF